VQRQQPTLTRERSQSAGSNNSIEGEFSHFRPILSAPRSPPKKLADGSLMEPRLVKPSQCKHLFGAGNIAEFLRKQDMEQVTPTSKMARPVFSPVPRSELKTAEVDEEMSQSLLASDNGDDAGGYSPTLLLTDMPTTSDEESASDASTPVEESPVAGTSCGNIDTQSLLSLLEEGTVTREQF
jgi:hypothetical protein